MLRRWAGPLRPGPSLMHASLGPWRSRLGLERTARIHLWSMGAPPAIRPKRNAPAVAPADLDPRSFPGAPCIKPSTYGLEFQRSLAVWSRDEVVRVDRER